MRNRFWFAICCLPMAIAVVAVGLTVWITPTREQRAIANLVKAGAQVDLFEWPNGNRYFNVDLSTCTNNDDLLNYAPEIGNVQGIQLAYVRLDEAGVKCLRRVKGLRYLDVSNAILPLGRSELERELRNGNPGLKVFTMDPEVHISPEAGRSEVGGKQ